MQIEPTHSSPGLEVVSDEIDTKLPAKRHDTIPGETPVWKGGLCDRMNQGP